GDLFLAVKLTHRIGENFLLPQLVAGATPHTLNNERSLCHQIPSNTHLARWARPEMMTRQLENLLQEAMRAMSTRHKCLGKPCSTSPPRISFPLLYHRYSGRSHPGVLFPEK